MRIQRTNIFWTLFLFQITLKGIESKRNNETIAVGARQKRVFSLFNVVTFANDPCRSTEASSNSGFRNGTCFTKTECQAKGGTSQGNCASGFGVCCVFRNSAGSGTLNQNCSYITNPGFPNSYTEGTAVTYTVNKCAPGVCLFRLDFESFTLSGPALGTLETNGGQCSDTFTVTSTSGSGLNVPQICGSNTGQHIYVDVSSTSGNGGGATLNFGIDGTMASTTRQWDIKVTQIPCASDNAPPNGCLQYHTGTTGRMTTFNFAATNSIHLANQRYSSCVRQSEGFCCVQYTPCVDVGPSAFSLSTGALDTNTAVALVGTLCSLDYIIIAGSSAMCTPGIPATSSNKYCGSHLNQATGAKVNTPICDCAAPFAVEVVTDMLPDVGTPVGNLFLSRGVCLDWMQIKCN